MSIQINRYKLIGKYWRWDKSLPENIIFGINGSILFTNDSIYVNELENRYKYSDFNPHGNRFSIQKILFSRRLYFTGKKDNWWIDKHNPNNDIPKNIYLLGKGTIQQLHIEYIKNYGHIEWSDFINYTRELIKQKIMI